MGVTTIFGLPYPEQPDTPDVPRDIKALADAVDALAWRICYVPFASTDVDFANYAVAVNLIGPSRGHSGLATVSGTSIFIDVAGAYQVNAHLLMFDSPEAGAVGYQLLLNDTTGLVSGQVRGVPGGGDVSLGATTCLVNLDPGDKLTSKVAWTVVTANARVAFGQLTLIRVDDQIAGLPTKSDSGGVPAPWRDTPQLLPAAKSKPYEGKSPTGS
jgi:hypothetical protein